MSEHQCYEFLALDRSLSEKQMQALRALSSRAEITPTRFWNEYHYGDFSSDPLKVLARYFDAGMYFANWGTRRLMLRIPKTHVDAKALKPYFTHRSEVGEITLATAGAHLILDFNSELEEYDDEEASADLAALATVRTELMYGDLRPAYLGWLFANQYEGYDDDDDRSVTEPPVPPGLATLTPAQEAMADFLRIDPDLIAAAARASVAVPDDQEPLQRWLLALPIKQKDAWLRRAADEPGLALGRELVRAFRATARRTTAGRTTVKSPPGKKRRTAAELRTLAETLRLEAKQAEAQRRKAKAAKATNAPAREQAVAPKNKPRIAPKSR